MPPRSSFASFRQGELPDTLKDALVGPTLKNNTLNSNDLTDCSSFSSLLFLGKKEVDGLQAPVVP